MLWYIKREERCYKYGSIICFCVYMFFIGLWMLGKLLKLGISYLKKILLKYIMFWDLVFWGMRIFYKDLWEVGGVYVGVILWSFICLKWGGVWGDLFYF